MRAAKFVTFVFNVRDRSRRFTPTLHMLRNDDSRKDEGRSSSGTRILETVQNGPVGPGRVNHNGGGETPIPAATSPNYYAQHGPDIP